MIRSLMFAFFLLIFLFSNLLYAHPIPFVVHEFAFDYQEKDLFIDYRLRLDPIVVDKVFDKIDYNKNEILDSSDAEKFFSIELLSNIQGRINHKELNYEYVGFFEERTKADFRSFDDYWGFRMKVVDINYAEENLIKFKTTLRFIPEDEYGDSYYYDDNLFDNKYFSTVILQSDYENIDILSYKVRFAKKNNLSAENQNSTNTESNQKSFFNSNWWDFRANAEKIINYVRTIDITSPFVFFTFAGLLILAGTLHSLTPGHGKTLISTVILTKRKRNFFDLIILALSLTFSHTLIVFLVGISVFLLQKIEYLNTIVKQFEIFGYVIFFFLGLYLVFQGMQNRKHYLYDARSGYSETGHSHLNLPKNFRIRTRRDILWVGFVGGITPCINATVVFTFFLIQGEIMLGILAVLLYSIGIAVGIILIGTTIFYGFKKLNLENKLGDKLEYILPIFGGTLIILLSIFYIFN